MNSLTLNSAWARSAHAFASASLPSDERPARGRSPRPSAAGRTRPVHPAHPLRRPCPASPAPASPTPRPAGGRTGRSSGSAPGPGRSTPAAGRRSRTGSACRTPAATATGSSAAPRGRGCAGRRRRAGRSPSAGRGRPGTASGGSAPAGRRSCRSSRPLTRQHRVADRLAFEPLAAGSPVQQQVRRVGLVGVRVGLRGHPVGARQHQPADQPLDATSRRGRTRSPGSRATPGASAARRGRRSCRREATIPRPNRWCQTRLTATRATNGLRAGSVSCRASSSRPLPRSCAIRSVPASASRDRRGTTSPGDRGLPRTKTCSSTPVPSSSAGASRGLPHHASRRAPAPRRVDAPSPRRAAGLVPAGQRRRYSPAAARRPARPAPRRSRSSGRRSARRAAAGPCSRRACARPTGSRRRPGSPGRACRAAGRDDRVTAHRRVGRPAAADEVVELRPLQGEGRRADGEPGPRQLAQHAGVGGRSRGDRQAAPEPVEHRGGPLLDVQRRLPSTVRTSTEPAGRGPGPNVTSSGSHSPGLRFGVIDDHLRVRPASARRTPRSAPPRG